MITSINNLHILYKFSIHQRALNSSKSLSCKYLNINIYHRWKKENTSFFQSVIQAFIKNLSFSSHCVNHAINGEQLRNIIQAPKKKKALKSRKLKGERSSRPWKKKKGNEQTDQDKYFPMSLIPIESEMLQKILKKNAMLNYIQSF